MDIAAGVASILNLTAVSVCRYIQVAKPYKYIEIVTKRRVITAIVTIWLFSITTALLKGVIPRNTWFYQPGYQLLVFFTSFVLPLTGISYCYFNVFREVSRHQRQILGGQPLPKCAGLPADIKAIRTILIVILMFVICWCPFFVVVLANGFCKCVTNIYLISFVKIMHYSSSALNPIIYVWHNRGYRKAFIIALNKFAHQREASFLISFINEKPSMGEGINKNTGKIVLLRL